MANTSTRRIRTSNIAAMPWKNGGGVTRELATGGAEAPGSMWGWRVSLAEVAENGPFSSFPGIDRIIAVIGGPGMDLVRPDGATLALEPFQPAGFAGEEPLSGRLRAGPVRDLNVMVRRGAYAAEITFLRGLGGTVLDNRDEDCAIALAIAGGCPLRLGGNRYDLAPGEALIHEGAGGLKVQLPEGGLAALIRISAR